MIRYPLHLTPDDNDTLLVTSPDLPEVTSWGLDEEHACVMGARAVEEAVTGRLLDGLPVPQPGEGSQEDDEPIVDLNADPGALPTLRRLSAPLDQDTTTALLLHWLKREDPPQGQDAPTALVSRRGAKVPLRFDLAVPPDLPGRVPERALPDRALPARRRSARR